MHHVLLLHGAIGASDQLLPLEKALKNDFIVHRLNFTGHGGDVISDAPFSIALFAQQVLDYIEQAIPANAVVNIFGYSMGGYVALFIHRHHPGKLHRVVTLATKFHWDEAVASREIKMLTAETILYKIPAFAEALALRHGAEEWKVVLEKTAQMLAAMGNNPPLQGEDYGVIDIPCLLLLGDRDKMVSLDETAAVYKLLPNAQLGILPAMGHPIEQINVALVASLTTSFLANA